MRRLVCLLFVLFCVSSTFAAGDPPRRSSSWLDLDDCAALLAAPRKIASNRDDRFLGKVAETTARCRGGENAAALRPLPWIDWSNYWATGDSSTMASGVFSRVPHVGADGRGVDGALLDLEYQRIELIKFNLFDNAGTYQDFVSGRTIDGKVVAGPAIRQWTSMRLPTSDPNFAAVGGNSNQLCSGDLIRFRNLTGICNDLKNPAMGSTGMLFARNAQFESTFPDLGMNDLARNRHGDRLATLKPDPQVISRTIFSRDAYPGDAAQNRDCNQGLGVSDSPSANCGYQPAPFFNVLAAFWIQFMTHDWFSHLTEGANAPQMMPVGCANKLVNGVEVPLTSDEIAKLGCRPTETIDKGLVADASDPSSFQHGGKSYLSRAYRTMSNTNTAWWDASQIYGFDERSRQRVKRNPADRAKLQMDNVGARPGAGEKQGYLPIFGASDPIIPQWSGQETAAFPDNWSIGMSFYHTVFSREHNLFVDEFRRLQKTTPDADSGLRNPSRPTQVIRYREVTDDELFELGRLVVAAEIAKIHTIEWTPQLLYDEPLFNAMNANWSGLFAENKLLKRVSKKIVQDLSTSTDANDATVLYSVAASGAGIFGSGNVKYEKKLFSKKDVWNLANPDDVNGGVNHFGSPFNFPEEFVTVYRLHPLLPDLLEYREWNDRPNDIRQKVSIMETVRGNATPAMRDRGVANWALTMGRQRLGLLTLGNHPRFLQNLPMPRLGPDKQIDVVALDLIRDRERGVPRFNEFRRQYGLRQLTSFDDFANRKLKEGDPQLARQRWFVSKLRELYGQHRCDAAKIITVAQRNADGSAINDCLGAPDGTMVDNIEDVDTIVGWLAEFTRPHGFAISETQFQVFILNASRRLFSDRFFTSSFRPEFYSTLGVQWVMDNGPTEMREQGKPNGHVVPVSPLKRVLMRTIPELQGELSHVVNAFDPWARDRGQYYSVDWVARPDAASDPAFPKTR